jgi:hypothetical protein
MRETSEVFVMENEKGRQTLGAAKLLKCANKAAMKLW